MLMMKVTQYIISGLFLYILFNIPNGSRNLYVKHKYNFSAILHHTTVAHDKKATLHLETKSCHAPTYTSTRRETHYFVNACQHRQALIVWNVITEFRNMCLLPTIARL